MDALVRQASHSDRAAFDSLYEITHRAVRSFLRHRVRQEVDIDDLVQRAYMKAYESLSQLKSQERFLAWLLAIAHHEWQHWSRHQSRQPGGLRSDIAVPAQTMDAPAIFADPQSKQIALAKAILNFDGEEGQILRLRFQEGLSCAEISRVFGLPAATVRSKLRRSLEKLRKTFDANRRTDSPS